MDKIAEEGLIDLFEQGLPEFTCEYQVAIRDDCRWQAMKLVHVVHEKLGHSGRLDWMAKRHEVHVLGVFVHNHQNGIRGIS